MSDGRRVELLYACRNGLNYNVLWKSYTTHILLWRQQSHATWILTTWIKRQRFNVLNVVRSCRHYCRQSDHCRHHHHHYQWKHLSAMTLLAIGYEIHLTFLASQDSEWRMLIDIVLSCRSNAVSNAVCVCVCVLCVLIKQRLFSLRTCILFKHASI